MVRRCVGLALITAGCEEAKDTVDGGLTLDLSSDGTFVDDPPMPPDYIDGGYTDYADGYTDDYSDGYYSDGYYTDTYTYTYTDYSDYTGGSGYTTDYTGGSGYTTDYTGGSGGTGPDADDLLPGDIVITEIMHDPSAVLDTQGEWFEVANTSSGTVYLDGLVVRDTIGFEQFVVTSSVSVAAGEHVVFGTQADPALNGGLVIDFAYPPADFVLANGTDSIVLANSSGLLDTVTYDDVTFPDSYGASMSLDPLSTDIVSNDLGTSWCAGVTSYGEGDLGTPGSANPPCVERSTGETGLGSPADDIVPGELVITEIMNNPSAVLDTQGEWFEVANTSSRTLDLDGLFVSNAAQSESFTVSGSLLLPPSAQLVLANGGDPGQNGGVTVAYAYTGFSLGNSADEIVLHNSGGALDAVSYDGGALFPDPSGASISLDPLATDTTSNDDGASWCEATTTFGSGDRGTPGTPNDPC